MVQDAEASADDPQAPRRTGRRVCLDATHAVFIGLDIAVGRLGLVALDLKAEILFERSEAVIPARISPEAVVERIARLVEEAVDRLPDAGSIRGLSIAVPGLLDRDGVLLRAPLLGWSNVPITKLLRAALAWPGPLSFENDANAFAFAEVYRDRASAHDDALFVYVDSGVGGGLIAQGKIVRGARGFAGEIGHIGIGDKGFASVTDLPGSLESYVGRRAVMARYRHYGGESDSLEAIVRAVAAKEPAGRAMLSDWASWLGRGLASLTAVLDPGKIILGGPVAALFPYARLEVLQALRRNLLPLQALPTLVASELSQDAVARGAACILHHDFLELGPAFGGEASAPPPG